MGKGQLHTKGFDRWTRLGLLLSGAIVVGLVGLPRFPGIHSSKPDEAEAIAILRNVIKVQKEMRTHPLIDLDHDAEGEYAYFGELAGTSPLRFHPDAPTIKLSPPLLSKSMGKVDENGFVKKAGYYFRMFIAGRDGLPIPESPYGGVNRTGITWSESGDDIEYAESYYACYAWPVENCEGNHPAFMCNQEGEVLQTSNTVQQYSGSLNGPQTGLEAYERVNEDMTDPLGISVPGGLSKSRDKGIWTVVD